MPPRNNPRSWGSRFDPLTPAADSITPSPQSQTAGSAESNNCPPDRVVHDASIFIGCLPSGVDHATLSASLAEHLSQYSEIQGIKVVHDSKGGTCAFIQCQDPFTAATLLQTLRALPPCQFMGRYLRYEPARAFRTLLISYRSPRQYKGNVHPDGTPMGVPHQLNCGEFVELELPTAMKLIKTPGARRRTILYNSDALKDHGYEGISLLLDPLLYDTETLKKIATLFGPVEHFRPYKLQEDTSRCSGYLNLHNSPRSALMDLGCWEVKWCHRDDCVSAWMTLRSVPHLTVTWAHQSHSEKHGQQQSSTSSASPSNHTSQAWGSHVVARDSLNSPECSRFIPSFHGPPMNRDSFTDQVDLMPTLWVRNAPTTPDTGIQQCRPRAASLTQPKTLPPLQSSEQLSTPCGLALKNRFQGPFQAGGIAEGPVNHPSHASASNRRIMYSATFTALPPTHPSFSDSGDAHDVNRQEVPSSPKLVAFPAPSEAGGRRSRTPDDDFSIMSPREFTRQLMQSSSSEGDNVARDPTTIFVGGLRMSGPKAWVESKIRAIFSNYGGVKDVTVVRPVNNRPGYAFVKFDNTESPLQAISREHNRIVDGRRIRVQLRDLRPYRWKTLQSISSPEVQGSEPSTGSGEGSQDNLTHGKTEMSSVTEDMRAIDLKDVSAVAAVQDARPLHEGNDEHHANHVVRGAQGSHRALTAVAVPTRNQHQGTDNNTPPGTVDVFHTNVALVPPPVTAHPVPAFAYYHPQGWMPGFGPYSHPLLIPHYPGYQVAPQMTPPFLHGSGVEGTQSPLGPAPLNGLESGTIPYTLYPHVVGYPFSDGTRPGTATMPPNPNHHVPAPLPPTGLHPGDRGPPFPTSHSLNGGTSFTPENENSSSVTWRPYPPMQSPPVFFHPFSQPLPFPGNTLGPNLWLPNYGWHEEMLHPSAVQALPRPLIPSTHEVNVEPRLRNHPSRRPHRRDGYHRNNQSRAPAGR